MLPVKKTAVTVIAALTGMGVLSSCSTADASDSGEVRVVATFSIISDIAENIAGDEVDVHSIVPLGVDPHEYTPLSDDIKATTEADLVLWNGLNMEVGDGWFESLTEVADKNIDDDNVVEVSSGVEPMHLTDAGGESEINPHAFLDPNVGMIYAENIRDGLIEVDPDNAEYYRDNAEEYLAELREIDSDYDERLGEIPEEHRLLVASENAYQYMADRYGLTPGYIWAIDTDEQGSPQQIAELVELIKQRDVPAVFVESNVDTRPMETVANEADVEIAGTIFSDELGEPGKDGGTYVSMLEHNLEIIHAGLTEDASNDDGGEDS